MHASRGHPDAAFEPPRYTVARLDTENLAPRNGVDEAAVPLPTALLFDASRRCCALLDARRGRACNPAPGVRRAPR